MDCARLVEDLEDASSRGILKKRLKYYAHSRLLIIDELGYLDVGSVGADLLFQLIFDALRAALDDHHRRRGDRRLGQGVRGRRGGERDRGQGVPPLPPLPPGQDSRQVLQAEGPAEGRTRQGVTGIGENTLAQAVKPPLRERRVFLISETGEN